MKHPSKSNIEQITLRIQFQHERVTHIKIQVQFPHIVKDQHNQQNDTIIPCTMGYGIQ